ncbi:MAG TPA: hypothetical protein VL335_03820 [Candidatus Paceibacterota bacterium]|jgi:predicted GH43/DUF377 family glycosyl hydrolase|nr:hypothetical protein [Candidatus Paceibacterota bacterium]
MDPALLIIISLLAFGLILIIFVSTRIYPTEKTAQKKVQLNKSNRNPIVTPRRHREWETHGTFNPGAIIDDAGTVHLFYRAIGEDGMSRVGHASSTDGIHFDNRSLYPVYEARPGFGIPDPTKSLGPKQFDPLMYTSGGSWGGTEDPRAVRIGDRVYMIFLAFSGWDDMRIAVTSLKIDDLKKRRWKWKKATFLSPAKSRNKNWVIFPEKINGKFAILHGISPRIMVDYIDTLDGIAGVKPIKSSGDHGGYGYSDPQRSQFWDNRVRGVGAPPIKTSAGWLTLYHGIDNKEPHKYKVGAMLLDLQDPTKVLYRSPEPILEPDMHYENDGKPGIVYASGAVVKDGRLLVYYGGGDRHVCVAEISLNELLQWLVECGKV